ncbi:UDP-glycosyltransferase 83A1 [Cannabis sativa]|uniref:UDP-glycosyltransferase 83A1 n=1 Tax=Cannabis sativa TaxID=3483 RepID=UPI0029CA3D1A|nr:UDP-glycosyltransferase 83A1 [Cannabis sativa]
MNLNMMSGRKQRVMMVPAPAQGHVKPLMLLAHKLAQHGFRITFVYTQLDLNQITRAMDETRIGSSDVNNIELVSIPDGLGPQEERSMINKTKSIVEYLPMEIEKLIASISSTTSESNDKISCVVFDAFLGISVDVATKMGIQGVLFSPSSAAALVHAMNIQNLICDGVIDSKYGTSTQKQMIQLLPGMPGIDTSCLLWKLDELDSQQLLFQLYLNIEQALKSAQWCLCNTTHDLESVALHSSSSFLPIGPLMENKNHSTPSTILGSQFWAEDTSCLTWLDQHEAGSVIYVAFGSITVHNEKQFHEIARGLELTGKPFLWVVRLGYISSDNEQEKGFDPYELLGKNSNIGKIVSWAPQEKVLSHPSIACFITHCGWNSTLECLSIGNGIPFLCWPYFADQFLNKDYICNVWKIGMGFIADENGIVTSDEIKNKVDKLLNDVDIRRRSLSFKEMAMKSIAKNGHSSTNLNNFITWLEAL